MWVVWERVPGTDDWVPVGTRNSFTARLKMWWLLVVPDPFWHLVVAAALILIGFFAAILFGGIDVSATNGESEAPASSAQVTATQATAANVVPQTAAAAPVATTNVQSASEPEPVEEERAADNTSIDAVLQQVNEDRANFKDYGAEANVEAASANDTEPAAQASSN